MADDWYYKSRDEVHGPLSFVGILEKGRQGELSPDDLIRQGTDGEWVSVASVSASFSNLKPADPPETGNLPESAGSQAAGDDLDEYQDLSELQFASDEPAAESEELPFAGVPVDAAWSVRVFGTEMGPMSFDDLQMMAEQGELLGDDEVRSDEHADWVAATTIEGLLPAANADWNEEAPSSTGAETSRLADLSELEREASDPVLDAVPPVAPAPEQAAAARKGWYCEVLGSELGPMSFDDLQTMARHDELSPDDRVRHNADGRWMPAGDVKDLFPATEPAPTEPVIGLDEFQFVDNVSDAISAREETAEPTGTSVSAESEVPDPDETAVEHPSDFDRDSQVTEEPAVELPFTVEPMPIAEQASVVERLSGAEQQTAETELGDVSAPPASDAGRPAHDIDAVRRATAAKSAGEDKPTRPRRRLAWDGLDEWLSRIPVGYRIGAVAVVVLIVLVAWLGSFGGRDQTYYDTCMEIWNQHKEMRDRRASAEEWSSFSKEAKQRLAPIIADLGRSAGAEQPLRQHLLWASRDYLPMLIVNAREKPNDDEELFAGHMEDVRLLLAGEAPRPRTEATGDLGNAKPTERGDFEREGSGKRPVGGISP